MSGEGEGGRVDQLERQRDMMRRSADDWRGRASVAEATITAVRALVDAWNTEGLGHAPGTNYPDAWADLNRLLDGADTGHGNAHGSPAPAPRSRPGSSPNPGCPSCDDQLGHWIYTTDID